MHCPSESWYGGSVCFPARVKKAGPSESFTLDLLPPTLGPSTRFTRAFGSHSFVRVKLDQGMVLREGRNLIEFFQTPFIIGGRVFRAFYAKENTVHLFMTNETVVVNKEGSPVVATNSKHEGMSVMEFLQWHNDPYHNSAQV